MRDISMLAAGVAGACSIVHFIHGDTTSAVIMLALAIFNVEMGVRRG
jgi:hypothetical protein